MKFRGRIVGSISYKTVTADTIEQAQTEHNYLKELEEVQ